MSRGPRQQHQQHHNQNQQQQNHGAGTTTTASATNSPPQHARRANRTLGWYLGGLMAEKNQNAGAGGGMEVNQATKENTSQHQMHMVTANEQQRRKRSVVDTSSSATAHTDPRCSSPRVQHTGNGNNNWHHRQKMMAAAGDRTRASSSASSASKKSATKPEGHQQPQQQQSQFGKEQQNQPQQQQHQQIELHKMGAGGAGSKPASGKENYWYYDPVSDGYYYEHNGTRGWRKRSAKLDAAVQAVQMKRLEGIQQKIAEQQKKFATAAAEAKAGGAIPSLLGGSASQQLNKFFPGNATNNVPFGSPMAIKYYDNDGYFYEMASVDGWRRRQPTTGNTSATNGGISTPPNSLASSLGGTTSHQPPKVPSPAPAAIANAKPPRRKPLHYAAYQQPPPQLLNTSLDLKELLLLAKQQQQHHHNHQQQQPPCCCPAAVGANLMAPSPAPCCCTIAAMAAQMILQKHRQLVERSSIGGGSSEHNNSATLTTAEIPKTKSMECVRSLLEGLSLSKPASVAKEQQQHLLSSTNSQTNIGGGGAAATAQQNKAAQQHVDSVAANWQFSQSNKWNGFGTAAADDKTTNGSGNNNSSTTTTLSVGSFEEPYEFYWSGDETSSEVVAPHVIGTGKLAPPAMALTEKHEESETIGGGGDGEQATMISSSTTAASVSSMDDDGLDEMMQSGGVEIPQPKQQQKRDPLSIAPIGSEATMRRIGVEEEKAAQQQQHQRYQLKRPDFLRLACPPKSMQIAAAADYEPMSPGEVLKEFMDNGGETAGRRRRPNKIGINAMPQQQQQPHNFDVDKFIADLPPMPFDHERFLQNLRNPLRTPIGPAPATFEPIPNDSPLFTPICFGKNAWGYRQHENPWAYP